MPADVIYGVDFRAKVRRPETLEQMAVEIMGQVDTSLVEMIPYSGAGIDGMFTAPDKDSAR